jgi:hypothetical protein
LKLRIDLINTETIDSEYIINVDLNGEYINWYEKDIKPYLNKLIIQKINTFKPKFVICFSEHEYDYIINDMFNIPKKISIKGFSEKELCEINIPNVKMAFLTCQRLYFTNQQPRPKGT